jgi:hypothetical protein
MQSHQTQPTKEDFWKAKYLNLTTDYALVCIVLAEAMEHNDTLEQWILASGEFDEEEIKRFQAMGFLEDPDQF